MSVLVGLRTMARIRLVGATLTSIIYISMCAKNSGHSYSKLETTPKTSHIRILPCVIVSSCLYFIKIGMLDACLAQF